MFRFLVRLGLVFWLAAVVQSFTFPQYNAQDFTQAVNGFLSPVTQNFNWPTETFLDWDGSIIRDLLEKSTAARDVALAYVTEERQKFAELHTDVKEKLRTLDQDVRNMVDSAKKLNGVFEGVDHEKVSQGWTTIQETVSSQIQDEFPLLEEAPRHERRKEHIIRILEKVEDQLVLVLGPYTSTPEEELRKLFATISALIVKILVTIGDIIEQYPMAAEMLLMGISIMLLGSAPPFLQTLLSLFGFGPAGPIKGTAASWAQRYFWGAAVQQGSWFALLQHMGMKGVAPVWNLLASAGLGGLAAKTVTKLFSR